MFIYLLLITIFSLEIYKNIYPAKCEELYNKMAINYNKLKSRISQKILNAGYNCVYFYSVCQIKYNKYLSAHVNLLKDSSSIKGKINVGFIKDGTNIHSTDYEVITDQCFENKPNDYDLIIITDHTKIDRPLNHICTTQNITDFNYKESELKFIAVNIEYNNKPYQISLKTDDYNFYIVNNIINSNFFKYYINIHLKENIENINFSDFKYRLEIIDHNVNFHTLNETHSIIIKENNYEIIQQELTTDSLRIDTSIIKDYDETRDRLISDASDDFVKIN
jgi:hypothetical protein